MNQGETLKKKFNLNVDKEEAKNFNIDQGDSASIVKEKIRNHAIQAMKDNNPAEASKIIRKGLNYLHVIRIDRINKKMVNKINTDINKPGNKPSIIKKLSRI